MVLAFSAFLIRHGTAEKRAGEAEKRPLEGEEEEEAMTRYQKIRFLLNGPCVFCIFEDAVTCSGASVPENVQKPPRLCTKVRPPGREGTTPREGNGGHFGAWGNLLEGGNMTTEA